MKKKFLFYAAILLLLVAGAFYFFKQPASAPVSPQLLVITMGPQSESGISGNALISEIDGKLKVALDLMGGPKGIAQPAHIHFGSCAEIGGVKYPLVFPVDGKSETMLDITMAELQGDQPLAINVHKSKEEAGVYVSCGDIVFD